MANSVSLNKQKSKEWEDSIWSCFSRPKKCFGLALLPYFFAAKAMEQSNLDFGTPGFMTFCFGMLYVPLLLLIAIAVSFTSSLSASGILYGLFGLAMVIKVVIFAFLRVKIRKKYSVEGAYHKDIAMSIFCESCSLGQISTEIKHHKEIEQKNSIPAVLASV
eukprot:TRINITY_DN776181_c0_g1_i1.p1 TRINITY_DN776181_c0_g1~~TRINITY_DN776181_c0_g1_i1.p1  ORF type:complete len:162 (+),score=20.67 TRINITY_DN776181_c0_g1_i1:134-619(+)